MGEHGGSIAPHSDRRRGEREQVVLVVDYEGADDLVRDYTENLSGGGTFVHTERDLEVGTEVRLVLSFPGLIEPLRLRGVVRWSRDGEDGGVGIEFVDFGRVRDRLEQVVRGISRRDPSYVGRVVKVLVVEDNPHVAALIRDGLGATSAKIGRGVAFEFRTAENGVEAIAALEEEEFDVAIVDIYLPILDGAHVIAHLRAAERTRELPVIAVSAGGAAAREMALRAGADFFLEKPMRLRQIVDSMTKLFRVDRR